MSEIEDFKQNINISEYLAASGFVVDQNKTTPSSVCMRYMDQQYIVARNINGHWIYFEKGECGVSNSGTIIDLVENQTGKNLGDIKNTLRPWLGWKNRPKVNPETFIRSVKPLEKDEQRILQQYYDLLMIDETDAPKRLLTPAGIKKKIWNHKRFFSKLRSDIYNNVIFPNFYGKTVIGFEIYNKNFNGFPPGSSKGIWFSEHLNRDDTLIISNKGIRLLKMYAENEVDIERSWAISTGGDFGKKTMKMLRSALKKYHNQDLILAFDETDEGLRSYHTTKKLIQNLKLDSKIKNEISQNL